MNPFISLDKHLPDGEPHIYENKIYLYSSHDEFFGKKYCPLDYEIFSADINDLSNWTGKTAYKKTSDPLNKDGTHFLYAPDAVKGNDNRYYLYYFLESIDRICVAVSVNPDGPFDFYGYVNYCVDRDKLSDYPSSFDPAVFNDNGRIYLAFGFSIDFRIEGMNLNDKNTKGAYIVELDNDMLTMKTAPIFIVPGYKLGKGTSFEGHEFLEASSIRKFNNIYYFIYSSQAQHELCYATSNNILGPYTYRGILISNAFENGKYQNNWANNHGSLEKINNDYFIFYHRHSCGTQFSRQCCVEKIKYKDNLFIQAKPTSQGFEDILKKGIYPAGIACFVHDKEEGFFLGFKPEQNDVGRIQADEIVNITDTTITFRYFRKVKKVILNLKNTLKGTVTLTMNNETIAKKEISDIVEFICNKENTDIVLHFQSETPLIFKTITIE